MTENIQEFAKKHAGLLLAGGVVVGAVVLLRKQNQNPTASIDKDLQAIEKDTKSIADNISGQQRFGSVSDTYNSYVYPYGDTTPGYTPHGSPPGRPMSSDGVGGGPRYGVPALAGGEPGLPGDYFDFGVN